MHKIIWGCVSVVFLAGVGACAQKQLPPKELSEEEKILGIERPVASFKAGEYVVDADFSVSKKGQEVIRYGKIAPLTSWNTLKFAKPLPAITVFSLVKDDIEVPFERFYVLNEKNNSFLVYRPLCTSQQEGFFVVKNRFFYWCEYLCHNDKKVYKLTPDGYEPTHYTGECSWKDVLSFFGGSAIAWQTAVASE